MNRIHRVGIFKQLNAVARVLSAQPSSRTALLALIILLGGFQPEARAANCVWNGSTDSWMNAARWTDCGGTIPGAADSAAISSGTVTLDPNTTVATLTLSGGVLQGAGTLTVTGTFGWSGGQMTGTGTTAVSGTLAISGSSAKQLFGTRTLSLSGTGSWTNTGNINSVAGAVFNNSGTFNIQTDADYTSGAIINTGSISKTSGDDGQDTRITASLQNSASGSVSVSDGALSLAGGGSSSATYSSSASGVLRFDAGNHTLNASSSLTGTNIEFTGGTVTIAGTYDVSDTTIAFGNVVFNSASPASTDNLNFSVGTLDGSGTLDVTDTLNWTGGQMTGTGTTSVPGPATLAISGSAAKQLFGTRTLSNAGTGSWISTGSINSVVGAVFSNNGTFNIQTDADYTSGAIVNTGSITKSSGADGQETRITASLQNSGSGSVSVSAGALSLAGGGSSSATYSSSASGVLRFDAGNHTLNASSSLTGTNIEFTGGTVTIAGTYDVSDTTIAFGNVIFNSASPASTDNLHFSVGTLDGSGTLNVTDTLNWTGGQMTGTGTTSVPSLATLAISGSAAKQLFGTRTLSNAGTGSWIGTGSINSVLGAVFSNSGAFNIQTDADYTSGTIINTGSITKSVGLDNVETRVTASLQNSGSGSVSVSAGVLSLAGGGSSSSSYSSSASGVLRFDAGTHVLNASSSLTGTNIEFTGGTVTIAGAFNVSDTTTIAFGSVTFNSASPASTTELDFSSGTLDGSGTLNVTDTLNWSGGQMTGTGTTSVPVPGTLAISGSASKQIFGTRTLTNAGTGTWSGTGSINSVLGATFSNSGTFDIQTDADYTSGAIINSGSITKSVGADGQETRITATVTNSGTVSLGDGRLSAEANFIQTSGSTSLNGGLLAATGNFLNMNAGILTGAGTIEGNLISGANLTPGPDAARIDIEGNLSLLDASVLSFDLGGLTPGTQHDFIGVATPAAGNATVQLDGDLDLTFANGFENTVTTIDVFTLLSAEAPIEGSFANVPSGARLTTTDGIGSFVVHYGTGSPFDPNSVVISSFELPGGTPVPVGAVAWMAAILLATTACVRIRRSPSGPVR